MRAAVVFLMVLLVSTVLAGEVKISGFGQVKIDETNFSIPRLRVVVKGPLEIGVKGLKVSYMSYTDLSSTGYPKLGFANLGISFSKDWLPKVIVGRILEPTNWQWPGPYALSVLYYPAAAFAAPYEIGFYINQNYKGWWLMAGVDNGSGQMQDNNKSLDFASRISYDLPFGFTLGNIFRQGKQPDGYRKYIGWDVSWQRGGLKVNAGQNTCEFYEKQVGRWFLSTYDVSKVFQPVSLVESLEVSGKTSHGWIFGVNIFPTSKTVIRADYFKKATDGSRGWGILFQQIF